MAFLVSLLSCNMDVNTVDPQSSQNIRESQKNGLYIKRFYLDKTSSQTIQIDEVWAEYKWKNEASLFSKSKKKIGDFQMVMKIREFGQPNLSDGKYAISWKLEALNLGKATKSNGIYTFSLHGKIPDTVQVNILEGEAGGTFLKTDSFKVYTTND